MKNIYKIYIKFTNSKRKQITFALFALLIYLEYIFITTQNDNTNILKSAVPVAVAAAAKAAAAGAAKGAAQGAMQGASNTQEGESGLGNAAKGALGGAAKGALSAGKNSLASSAKTANASKRAADTAKKTQEASQNINQQPKNTNPNGQNTVDNLNAKPTEMNEGTSKEAQKESSKSETEKSEKENKGMELDVQDDTSEEEVNFEEGSKALKSKNMVTKFLLGCGISSFLPLILFVVLIYSVISPNTTTISEMDCTDSDSAICSESSDDSSFFEKIGNLFKYGKYTATENIASEKAKDVYDIIYERYSVGIDVPTLLASLFSDSPMVRNEGNDELEYYETINLEERITYMEDLAKRQIVAYEMKYICKAHGNGDSSYSWSLESAGQLEYMEGFLDNIDINSGVGQECNADTVGDTKSEYKFTIDIEDYYYSNLKDYPTILGEIYGEDEIKNEDDLDRLINNIQLQVGIFKQMFEDDLSESGTDSTRIDGGDIPESLIKDGNVNIQLPIKGSYQITSGYGYRTGTYAGFHSGVDLVSSDDTIYAAGAGVVIWTGTEEAGGNVIEIMHTTATGEKYLTLYGHLSKFLVSEGDVVTAGDSIGIMGSTGISSGKHLHFEVRWDENRKVSFDPSELF